MRVGYGFFIYQYLEQGIFETDRPVPNTETWFEESVAVGKRGEHDLHEQAEMKIGFIDTLDDFKS